MDVWTTIVAGGVGLLAGQVGAWLQSRRDAAADERRQGAETERLRMQLADASRHHERSLAQADLIEWRERRLAIYQDASSALQELDRHVWRLIDLDVASEIAAASNQVNATWQRIDPTLDRCSIISTQQTRRQALNVSLAYEDLAQAVKDYAELSKKISSQQGEAEFTRQIKIVLSSRFRAAKATRNEQLASCRSAVAQAQDKVWDATAGWRTAARAELGMPAGPTPAASP